ncbi:hypothetical protein FOZ63_012632, partial [Perkinsus olseni]
KVHTDAKGEAPKGSLMLAEKDVVLVLNLLVRWVCRVAPCVPACIAVTLWMHKGALKLYYGLTLPSLVGGGSVPILLPPRKLLASLLSIYMPPIGHHCLSMSCLSLLLAVVVVVLATMLATFDMITSRGFLPITVRTALNSVPLFNSRQHYAFSDLPDNLTGTTILITGASSGIGHEAAKLMAERGARVVLGTRGSRGRLKSIENSLGPGVAASSSLDLASFSSIREFVRSLSDLGVERIDSALLNAGKMSFGYEEGELGIEMMMAVHHLGHAYLLELLMPLMLASQHPRVVFVSSSAHAFSYAEGIRFNSTAGSFGLYFQAYASSKLANAVY